MNQKKNQNRITKSREENETMTTLQMRKSIHCYKYERMNHINFLGQGN